MNNTQGTFDFEQGNLDGFVRWQRELDAQIAELRQRWGLPIGKRVRVKLFVWEGLLEGRLRLADLREAHREEAQVVSLQIGSSQFASDEIESCIVVE